jgi:hypothetical protein
LTKKTAKKIRKHSSSSKQQQIQPKLLCIPNISHWSISSACDPNLLRSTTEYYEVGSTETILKRKRIKEDDDEEFTQNRQHACMSKANLEFAKKIRSKASDKAAKSIDSINQQSFSRRLRKGLKPKNYVDTSGKETDDDPSKTSTTVFFPKILVKLNLEKKLYSSRTFLRLSDYAILEGKNIYFFCIYAIENAMLLFRAKLQKSIFISNHHFEKVKTPIDRIFLSGLRISID